jgi:hypothetical protein
MSLLCLATLLLVDGKALYPTSGFLSRAKLSTRGTTRHVSMLWQNRPGYTPKRNFRLYKMYWHLTAVTAWQSPCSTIVLGKFFPARHWIGLRYLSLFLSSPCPCLSYLSSVFYFPSPFQLILPMLTMSLVAFFVFCVYCLILFTSGNAR